MPFTVLKKRPLTLLNHFLVHKDRDTGCLPFIPRTSPNSSPNAPVSDLLYLEYVCSLYFHDAIELLSFLNGVWVSVANSRGTEGTAWLV